MEWTNNPSFCCKFTRRGHLRAGRFHDRIITPRVQRPYIISNALCCIQCLRKRIKKFTVIGTLKNGTAILQRYVFYVFKLTMKIRYSCKHCAKEYTGNVTYLKKHLDKCRIFLKTVSKDKKEAKNLLPQAG